MTHLTEDSFDTLVLGGALKTIGRMMTLPLADADEVDEAETALRETVSEALSQTAGSADGARKTLLEIEARLDDIPGATDEAAFAIWDIARDAFRASQEIEDAAATEDLADAVPA